MKEAGRIVRNEVIASPDVYSSWPPTGQERLNKKFELPFLTETLLLSILTSSNKKADRISRIVNSLAQDLIYNARVAKKRVPKYVQLGLTVKRKTGSVSTIRLLNRFGHCISYDEINATKTMLVEERLINENARRYLPNNIQPDMFVTLVYDNCDHNAESICNVPLHRTSGIVIQASKYKFNGIVSRTFEPSTSKRHLFKPALQEFQPYIKSKHRPDPLPIQNLENNVNQLDGLI